MYSRQEYNKDKTEKKKQVTIAMALLYAKEHLECFNYEKNIFPTLEILTRKKGDVFDKETKEVSVFFILGGSCQLSYASFLGETLHKGQMILFPPGSFVKFTVEEDIQLISFQLKGIVNLCNCFPIDKLFSKNEQTEEDHILPVLPIKPPVHEFLSTFKERIRDGLKCVYFMDLKFKEFMFLLRGYYTKNELKKFFSPLAGSDALFSILVYKNYMKASNVQALVDISGYSMSGFKKKFKKVFGVAPAEWLKEQKAKSIFHDITSSELSIKEIGYKYEFGSIQSFTQFCKNHFGNPPGKIRQDLKVTV